MTSAFWGVFVFNFYSKQQLGFWAFIREHDITDDQMNTCTRFRLFYCCFWVVSSTSAALPLARRLRVKSAISHYKFYDRRTHAQVFWFVGVRGLVIKDSKRWFQGRKRHAYTFIDHINSPHMEDQLKHQTKEINILNILLALLEIAECYMFPNVTFLSVVLETNSFVACTRSSAAVLSWWTWRTMRCVSLDWDIDHIQRCYTPFTRTAQRRQKAWTGRTRLEAAISCLIVNGVQERSNICVCSVWFF